MTAKVGGLSASIIALIAVGGVAGLLAILVLTAVIFDIPKRLRRKQNKTLMDEDEKDVDVEEKGPITVTEAEVLSTKASTNFSSIRPARPASPECQCEHPTVSPQPPRI